MRLSHTRLEAAKNDPISFISTVSAPYAGTGPSRMQYVILALKHYHESGLNRAIDYVEAAFNRRGFRLEHLDRYIGYLLKYDSVLQSHPDWELIVLRDRINYEIIYNFVLSGEVGRVDLTPRGYYVWLFSETTVLNWNQEFRMPILQAYYADEFGAPLGEVYVGRYSFSEGLYESEHYSNIQVNDALNELRQLGVQLLAGGEEEVITHG